MDLITKIRTIPTRPGVYLYKNAEGEVIYVGKAKNLRARVRSYFQEGVGEANAKTGSLLREAVDIDYIVVDNNKEALALENNLIKQKKPRFNILLRDDKTYPYIKLTLGERFPRVYVTRRLKKDGSEYYGPYFPGNLAYRIVDLVHRHFLVPSCKVDLTRFHPRPCLQYYIKRCLGPCVQDLTTPEAYQEAVRDVQLLLEGRQTDLSRGLRARMQQAAEDQEYERAARYRHMIRHRVTAQHTRNHSSESHIERLLRYSDPGKPNVLTIGFGRRFATYKRATLLFNDLDQFRRIVGDRERPVVFLFSGKAHPADEPGQELIRQLVHMSGQEEFQGRLLFLEGYDLHIARRLVSGVDVWLNNPVHPLEASGTSGMKAGMNGVVNLSILDGWWDEGYDGENGWAIKPASPHLDQHRRDREEARTLYELLIDRVIPLYYRRTEGGYSAHWIHMAKRSMASLLPRYDASRMLGEYVSKYYLPASRQGHRYVADGYAGAKNVAAWKARVRAAWPGVLARRVDTPPARIEFGEAIPVEVAVKLNGLEPADVTVELLLTRELRDAQPVEHVHALAPAGAMPDSQGGKAEQRYRLDLKPGLSGRLDYRIRVYPKHELLTHPFELGLATWV